MLRAIASVHLIFNWIIFSQSLPNIHTGYFCHLTDVHVNLNYDGQNCQSRLENYSCDPSLQLLISALNSSRNMSFGSPDFVIFSGDLASHGRASYNRLERTMQLVVDALKVVFPSQGNIPVIPCLGNRVVFAYNAISMNENDGQKRQWCTSLSPDSLGDWVDNNTSNVNEGGFFDGCYFSRLVELKSRAHKPLRVISLNSFIYSRGDPRDADPLGQFQWLLAQLRSSRQHTQKAIIVMHFPIDVSANSPATLHPLYSSRLMEIFVDFSDVIALVLLGRQHVDPFHILFSPDGKPAVSLLYNPSLSRMNFTGLGTFNPRLRVFKYTVTASLTSSAAFNVLDYTQLYLNLSGHDTLPSWRIEYAASEAYNLTDLSARSLAGFTTRLEQNHDIWCTYWKHKLDHTPGPCPELKSSRHCSYLCAMRQFSHPPSSNNCLQDCRDNAAQVVMFTSARASLSDRWNAVPVIALVIIAFLGILVGVVLLANREVFHKHRRVLAVVPGSALFHRQLVAYRRRPTDPEKEVFSSPLTHHPRPHIVDEEEVEEEEEEEDIDDQEETTREEAYDADQSGEEEEEEILNDLPASRFSRFSLRIVGGSTGRLFGRRASLAMEEASRGTPDDDNYYSVNSSLQRLCTTDRAGNGSQTDVILSDMPVSASTHSGNL